MIKVQANCSSRMTEEQMQSVRGMGIEYLAVNFMLEDTDYDSIMHFQEKAAKYNLKIADAKEQEKIEKVLENREKEVLNQFVNISAVVQSMIEAINEKIPDPRKWNRRLKATLFIKKFNEAVS